VHLQRLFSTFANGWPGRGLLLQRLLVGVALLECGFRHIGAAPHTTHIILHLVGAGAGIFLLVGLWTPIIGTIVAIVELSIAVFFHTRDPWMCVICATLGATLAMIGPGAWSIDARLFGRKHFAD
jgi:putative oxidoreductase